MNMESGRVNQKLRTRNAILKAVAGILKDNQNPTIDEIAEVAMVSRTTLYRYFPNIESLVIEASLDIKTKEAEELFEYASEDVIEKIGIIQDYLYDLAVDNEAQFRQFIKASMVSWLEKEGKVSSIRGGRRIYLLEAALETVEDQLPPEIIQKLVVALSALMGIESLIVVRDICEVSYQEGKETMNWAVKMMVKGILDEYSDKISTDPASST